MNTKRAVTAADLDRLETGVSEALTIVLGLLAEAAGSQKLAYHFAQAWEAAQKLRPNPVRDRLLDRSFQLVLLKASAAAPDDSAIQSLVASAHARQPKH